MRHQLEISPHTGTRRKGTTFKELEDIFVDKITTKLIFEPLQCCKIDDPAIEVQKTLNSKDFDVVGVIDEYENVVGFAKREELQEGTVGDHLIEFKFPRIIADSTPVTDLLNILSKNPFSFVVEKNKVQYRTLLIKVCAERQKRLV